MLQVIISLSSATLLYYFSKSVACNLNLQQWSQFTSDFKVILLFIPIVYTISKMLNYYTELPDSGLRGGSVCESMWSGVSGHYDVLLSTLHGGASLH